MRPLDLPRRATGAGAVSERLARVEADLQRLGRAAGDHERAHRRTEAASAHLGELERHLHDVRDEIATLERLSQVDTLADWLERAEAHATPLVSVVLPTRNRARLLARAVASVLGQSYDRFELLVVDDASTDDTAALLAAIDDPRVRVLHGAGRGAAAARNVALDAATGAVVAYVDDDNRMHRDWLRSLVWAFERQADTQVLYGALVVDDLARVQHLDGAELPRAVLHRWERAALEHHNLADMGTIAHRRVGPGPRFDESLTAVEDWDLLLQLTEDTPALALPAVATYYETTADERLTADGDRPADLARLRTKHR